MISPTARPRLLDLFSCAGGAARGYQQAGFYVVGVDIEPQPNYCGDEFFQLDAIDVLDWQLDPTKTGNPGLYGDWDAIHASPPCQDHSMLRNSAGTHGTGWLLEATLERLRRLSVPWVVENVVGAPLPTQPTLDGRYGVTLCGASFGLGASGMDLPRHRRFETSFPVWAPQCTHREGETMGVYGHGTNSWHREKLGRNLTIAEMREAMGIDWCTREELSQAIPPAFTKFIGEQLRQFVETAA